MTSLHLESGEPVAGAVADGGLSDWAVADGEPSDWPVALFSLFSPFPLFTVSTCMWIWIRNPDMGTDD